MGADAHRLPSDTLTEAVIGAAYRVANELGVGFLEKVYENSLAVELRACGLEVEQQKPVTVRYRGEVVGEYIVDLLVENELVVELKHTKALNDAQLAQTLNYLKATGYQLALLINFGTTRVQVKRVIRTDRANQ